MPSLAQHQSTTTTKALVIGNSGVGKTGLLGSLANAGYRLFIWDFDNGLDILMDPKVVLPEARKNVFFRTFTDKLGARGVPQGMPQACQQALAQFDKWTELGPDGKPVEMGNAYSWGERDVIVVDSLTFMGEAAMRLVLALGGMMGKPPQLQHWGEAIRIQESLLAQLYSEVVKCNVIITSHITFLQGSESGGIPMQKGYPNALGQKLPPKIGRYFNSVLLVEKQVVGQATKRVLKTSATTLIDLKNPAPSHVPAEMEPDLAKFFDLVRKGAQQGAAT